MTKFQIILTAIFGIGIVIGLASVALIKGNDTRSSLGEVSIWGTFPENTINRLVSEINQEIPDQISVSYTEKNQNEISQDLTEALADGVGPDILLIPQSLVYKNESKIILVPNTTVDQRIYKNTYIEAADAYLRPQGVVAIPFTINPMVMFLNRDTLTNAGIASYPKTWDDVLDISKKITQKDINSNIRKTAISFGEFENVSNAKGILSLLLLQAGSDITDFKTNPRVAEGVLTFFTSFANPSSENYSWNRSLPLSKNYFLTGNLAFYFGYAGELDEIREKNPNLNFDVVSVPQLKGTSLRKNHADLFGFSIVRSTKNAANAFNIINILTQPSSLEKLINMTYLPPVRRDLITKGNTDPYLSLFYDSALISRVWNDPEPSSSYIIFRDMVEAVTSGRLTAYQAVSNAGDEIEFIQNK